MYVLLLLLLFFFSKIAFFVFNNLRPLQFQARSSSLGICQLFVCLFVLKYIAISPQWGSLICSNPLDGLLEVLEG